ncbi:DUF5813 family protein [Haloprofundus salilacus]|uniref:DUF5813 family protein n=1 Tax=Haloprofundus salilacus TaxID=2876190 RepID=UPI001CCF9C20|nr:DUF5813 family protein [Haloprofundus salilacus]
MTDVPDRVHRAFRDHASFERVDETTYESVKTPFEGTVEVSPGEDGRVVYDVTVRVPMLDEVTNDEVADVVEEGWYETFELRVVDVGGVTAVERDLDPEVAEEGRHATVELSFEDINERRGVDDAGALVDFVEGTYAQGIIPGYDYTEPVSSMLSQAYQAGGSDPAE